MSGPGSASLLLRDLLTRDGAYRRRWRAEVRRASRNDPHQSAVAIVLAQHLWDIGEVPEADADLPRRLKDVVARAVGGGGISHQTLGWFVGAFEMTEDDEGALWRQHEADLRAPADDAPPDATASAGSGDTHVVAHPDSGDTYRTQSLIEAFEIDEHRSRRRHSVVHVLRAQQRLNHLRYHFDSSVVTVEVARGGTPTWREPDDASGTRTLDVFFPAPLEPGQTTVVETTASYAPGGPAVTHFRRSLRATAGGVSLEVHFDPRAVPSRVRWQEFGRAAGGELHTEELHTKELHTEETPRTVSGVLHRFLTPDRDCVVGFEWDW